MYHVPHVSPNIFIELLQKFSKYSVFIVEHWDWLVWKYALAYDNIDFSN